MRIEHAASGTRPRPHEHRNLSLIDHVKSQPWLTPNESDRWLLLMILAVGAIRPVQALLRHETWGAEAVLGLLMAAFAARAIVVDVLVRWPRRPLPR